MDSESRKEQLSDIILVGNGSSLLDKENGSLIDSFNIVVRFNSFKTENYERYVGRKTDIWFTVNSCHINEVQNFEQVICHSWAAENECKNFKKIKSNRPDAKMVNKQLIKSIPIKNPSTGLIAIFYFLRQYKKVHITGFDWWDRIKHHYGDREVRGTLHNPRAEYEIIKSLKDKIQFIC